MELTSDISVIRWVLSTIVVALLLGGFAILAPRLRGINFSNKLSKSGTKKRLEVVESKIIDARSKLVIVKIDNHEQTLLLTVGQAPIKLETPAKTKAKK